MTANKMILDNDGGKRVPLMDSSSHSQLVIESPHHHVHDELAYKLSGKSSDLSTTPVHLSFTTPNTSVRFHMLAKASAGGAATFTITEGPTGGVTGGSAATPLNRRRDSANTSAGTNFLTGATAPTGGTVLDDPDFGIAGGFFTASQAGESRDEAEWVLKPNTTYSFRLTSATAVAGSVKLSWYEHPDKG